MAIGIKLEKSGGSPGFLSVFGFFFSLVGMVMIVKTVIDAYRENRSANWPTAAATITQETLQKIHAGSRGEWYIELALRYTVDGKDVASRAHSLGGAPWEESSMRHWVSRHPPGTSLPIRYDPRKPNTVVLDARDMPESGPQVQGDLKAVLLFCPLRKPHDYRLFAAPQAVEISLIGGDWTWLWGREKTGGPIVLRGSPLSAAADKGERPILIFLRVFRGRAAW